MGEQRPERTFIDEEDAHFVEAVRAATSVTFERAAGQPPDRVYVMLAYELQTRGIEPHPTAVFDAALLISRGSRPAVLRAGGRRRRETTEIPPSA